jgi:NTE family protein
MRYFDSRHEPLTIKHVLASGALPPAFPAVRIGEDLFWDGGILSNTPVEAVFDDFPRKSSLVFAVHIWNPRGDAPESISQVMHRHKDMQYSSRAASHIKRQQQIHDLRRAIAQLGRAIPAAQRTPEIDALAQHGCLVRMHVVRLLAPRVSGEDHAKDIDFSAAGIRARWDAGYAETSRVLNAAPWDMDWGEEHGFLLHEASGGVMTPPEEMTVHA